MKAVLLSIKPEWWDLILEGVKGLEIRKNAPEGGKGGPEPWPLTVLAYVSGTGCVKGQFSCPGFIKTNKLDILEAQSCVPLRGLKQYASGKPLYGWIVKDAMAYEEPCPLAEFGLTRPPMSWQYIEIPDQEIMEGV